MKISRVNNQSYAIYECSNYGFSFGNTTFYMNSDHKIYFTSNQGYYDNNINNVGSPYVNQNGNFVPKEIEVFKVTTS
ncbi:hypothetical protein RhiirA5_367945 [Rhizophagus irregularis]|nr:hypothetical protein RhiirA5_367945 [Rhizophagus irregularis]PKY30570.1 hypothetical protein RhiirB3_531132 [Rhizophagus irregularis]